MSRKDLDEWILHMGVEMHRLSSELSPAPPKLARQKEWAPRVDVLETRDQVLVRVELAGVKTGQFVIHYSHERHSLFLKGERHDETSDPQVQIAPHQLEIDYGQFAREVKLPDSPLAVGRAQAQLSNGMLTILIPKDGEEQHPTVVIGRTITVRRLK